MFGSKTPDRLLSNSRTTETQLYRFLDFVIIANHHFTALWETYLKSGANTDTFKRGLADLRQAETDADHLKREIEHGLYRNTLIPDLRSDVTLLVKFFDRTINLQESIALHLSAEQPLIPDLAVSPLLELLETVKEAMSHSVLCARGFLTDLRRVREYNQQVILFKNESNELAHIVRQKIFESEVDLVEKLQTRYFIDRIDSVAGQAEEISDRIAILTIKRAQ